MKILHLIDSGGLYGAEKMLLTLVREQLEQGFEPMILSAGEPQSDEKPLEHEARRLGLPVTPWKMNRGLQLGEGYRILHWAKANGYDVLHSHGYKFNILIGLIPRRLRSVPFVVTLHGHVHARRFSKMWLYEVLDRIIIARASAVVAVDSGMISKLWLSQYRSKRLHVIPNGLDTEEVERCSREVRLDPKIERFLSQNSPIIIGVGRLSYEKGFERLIDGFSMVLSLYPEAGLVIVGEGRQREELESRVEEIGLGGRVIMPGFLDGVPSLMTRAHALVISSRTEGLPITLLEAMTIGVPIIASSVGAIPQVLGMGKGGWVTESCDAKTINSLLIQCLKCQCERNQKVKWSKHRVRTEFSSLAMAKSYKEIYEKVAF